MWTPADWDALGETERMAQSEPIHVLVVEDQVRVNETIVDILESRGYRVSSVSSGFAMFDLLRRDGSVAAIVLDALLPGEESEPLVLHAKRLGLAVVLVSGNDGARRLADQHGLPFVLKPFRMQRLFDAIELAISSRKAG
jgi:DNA-binding NtrC family response regulator